MEESNVFEIKDDDDDDVPRQPQSGPRNHKYGTDNTPEPGIKLIQFLPKQCEWWGESST